MEPNMSVESSLRREPCPACERGIVAVTHRVRLNGWGRIEADTPVSVAGCQTDGCQWNVIAAEVSRRSPT
jgi:hypothetical protein